MATIKLTNGNVTLKNGKPSCECCGVINSCTEKPLDWLDTTAFEITQSEYNIFYAGGKWTISGEMDVSLQRESTAGSGIPDATMTARGSGSCVSEYSNSCGLLCQSLSNSSWTSDNLQLIDYAMYRYEIPNGFDVGSLINLFTESNGGSTKYYIGFRCGMSLEIPVGAAFVNKVDVRNVSYFIDEYLEAKRDSTYLFSPSITTDIPVGGPYDFESPVISGGITGFWAIDTGAKLGNSPAPYKNPQINTASWHISFEPSAP